MFDNLTTFLLAFTLQHQINDSLMYSIDENVVKNCSFTSKELLDQIFNTLNSTENYKDDRQHKLSLSSDETRSHTQTKCNCKKSKCLKLYCECFAQGSLCQGCNCQSCHNTQEFGEVRAKAIDQMIMRSSITFGHKGSNAKGCNCRKTGCVKKYCQCFNAGEKCGEYCKCANCQNCE